MAQRRSTEEIERLVEQYRASGLTQIEYCRQTGMVLSTLGRYLRRGVVGTSDFSGWTWRQRPKQAQASWWCLVTGGESKADGDSERVNWPA
jgi:hypothetical protein